MGFAKRNSAAALEWARQKNARIQRAKEIKADRSVAQKRRELKELGVPGSPRAAKPDSGNKGTKSVEHDTSPDNGDHTDRQSALNPGERKILSGRRASIPEDIVAATTEQDSHPAFEKGATSRVRESLHSVDEAPECSSPGEELEETPTIDKVVRHGRRRTIASSLESEFDEESENRERSEEVLAAVRTKVANSRASARDTAWPAWAMIDDPIQKVKNKLHSKFGWLASARQPKPHIDVCENDGHGALRDKANHCPPTSSRESCIPRIDEHREKSPVDGVVFLQTDEEPGVVYSPVVDKDIFQRQRSARLEYLKRRSSARRLRKCMSEQRGDAAPECRVETPDNPSTSRSQEINGGTSTGSNGRGSISLLRPPPEARTLSPRLRSQSVDSSTRSNGVAADRSRKLSALKRQIVKSESCIASIEVRGGEHANADYSSRGHGDEAISRTQCQAGRSHHPVFSRPSPSSTSAPRARRLRRHAEENPETSCSNLLTFNAKYGHSSGEVEIDFPPEAFESRCESKRECASCGRKFLASSFSKHERVCVKVFKRKRKVFNSSAARLMGTGAEQHTVPQKPRRGRVAPPVARRKPTHWREKSSNLRDAMMCIRGN